MKILTRSLLCSVALLPSAALAQDSFSLSPIFVFGGLLPTTLESTGATIDLIEAEEIRQTGPGVADALERLPGVSLTSNGGLGTSTNIRIRGFDGAYIGVLVDGIEVSDPSSGQTKFNFGTFTSGTLDRVTVIKGTQSAIYGSDAIAGLIDVQTWHPERDGASGKTTLEYGSYNTRTATSSVGFRDDRVELAFSMSRVVTDGFSARTSDTEDDGFKQSSANLFAAYQVSDALRIGVAGLWSDGTTEIDKSKDDSSGELDQTRTGARVFAEFSQGAWVHEFSLSGFRSYRFDAGGDTEEFIGKRLKAAYLARVDLSPSAKLAFGIDWTNEQASFDGKDFKTSNTAAFGEVQFSPRDDLELSATLRYDDYSDFKGQFSGRAALAWNATDATTVRASLGSGYRAPSLYERFGPYSGPVLQPETSTSLDIGVDHKFGDFATLRATAFYIEIDNLIRYSSVTKKYAQLPGATVSKGLELSGDYAVSDSLKFTGNYTYTISKNNGMQVPRVPRHELMLAADYDVTDQLTAGIAIKHVAGAVEGSRRIPLDDYTVVDLTAGYDLTENTNAYLTIRNMTNKKYETVRGYNTSERALYVGIQADF